MTLREKVGRLVKYCGQYQSHGFMIDERNKDDSFYVRLPEEEEIRQRISSLKVILLTGEAGDGKSRLLRNLGDLLREHGFLEPCRDFSALNEEEKSALIKRLKKVLSASSQEKLIILANVGAFTQAVIRFSVDLMKELTSEREDVFLCNFENRNLADDPRLFGDIVNHFLKYEEDCHCEECLCYHRCPYKKNIQVLMSESGREAMRVICNAIYLKGGHVTFRELLSLLAYTVTFGSDCGELQEEAGKAGEDLERFLEKMLYYHVFEESSDLLLHKVSQMDPGLERRPVPKNATKDSYRNAQRKAFFDKGKDAYDLLHAEYLPEFYRVLEHMNQAPYYFDTVKDRNPYLQQLKKGINKMGSQGKKDTGLTITDTPAIFDKKIRLEFLLKQDVSLIWHRYDLQIGKRPRLDKSWNKFFLSYQYKEKKSGERKMISLLIDYNQFRYLMMCGRDYFLSRNRLNQEEYAVNTFYRKILAVKEDAYDAVSIRFEEKGEMSYRFSLKIHSEEDFFTGEKGQSILIQKEE